MTTNVKSRPARAVLVGLAALLVVTAAAAGLLARSEPAAAFGTVEIPKLQRPVHEKVTRVLGCTSTQKPSNCFEPISITMLAGGGGTFGAVGEPDNPLDGNPNPAARHCDDGDYGYGSARTQEQAWGALTECLDYYQRYMQFAVDSAAGLLRPDGTIDPGATDLINFWGSTYNACKFPDPNKGNTSNDSAKCNVLNGLGRALHLYEDFWSHSNWGDVAAPDADETLTNPAGLSNDDQPPFFAFPGAVATEFPDDLISGCDDSIPYLNHCKERTGHSHVNKDSGTVSPDTCATDTPLTNRGKVVTDSRSNFDRAVKGACGAALRAWDDLRAALVSTYGDGKAQTMIRAITRDTPLTTCVLSGGAAKAKAPPVGERSSARTVAVTVINNTGSDLNCSEAILDGGEWANYPADTLAPGATTGFRTQSNGVATGTEGAVKFSVAGSPSVITAKWNNPYIGSNSYRCDAGKGFTCKVDGGKGFDSKVTFTIARA